MKKLNRRLKQLAFCLCMLAMLTSSTASQLCYAGTTKGTFVANMKFDSNCLSKTDKEIFSKATKKLKGVKYTPIAVIGQQVVAGYNLEYLCKATTLDRKRTSSLKVMVIFSSPDYKKCKVISTKKFDPAKIKTCKYESNFIPLSGGWQEYCFLKKATLPKNVAKALTSADKKYADKNFKPIAFLGTRTSSSVSYTILCVGIANKGEVTIKTAQPTLHVPGMSFNPSSLDIVTVTQSAKGKATIKSVKHLDIHAYR